MDSHLAITPKADGQIGGLCWHGTRRFQLENINVLPRKPTHNTHDGFSFRRLESGALDGAHAPQRRAGVFTGASQSAVRVSSSSVTVTEQPAISSDVT